MNKIIIYTDGGARGNPGPAGIGVVITDEKGNTLHESSAYIGETTNNVAEYEALIRALEDLQMFGDKLVDMEVEVRMNSELIVRQMQGVYKVKEPTLKEKFAKIAHIKMERVPNLVFVHIPREKNARADELVNEAIDKALS
uniref:Ribonuclease H n=1 Tax=uncultured organism TaxID=155900 RepID=UPI0003994EF8|nr:Chain A, Ribonuclease H [uncultured organism]4H8K_B Chain B, Ribonuclease H [uncultured organism]